MPFQLATLEEGAVGVAFWDSALKSSQFGRIGTTEDWRSS